MAIILMAALIDSIGFGIVMPVSPQLVTEFGHLDLTAASRVAGWPPAAFAVAAFFAGPVIGNLSDTCGRRPVAVAAG